jgi:hypothetical protein
MTKYTAKRTASVGQEHIIENGQIFTGEELKERALDLMLSQNLIEELGEGENVRTDLPDDIVLIMDADAEITEAAEEYLRENTDPDTVVDLRGEEGSGEGGRFLKSDIEDYLGT